MRAKIDQSFNKIFIIESLRESDTKTGSDLYNNYLEPKMNQIEELEAELVIPETKQEFVDFLKSVSTEVKTTDLLPMFHFEIHGSQDGLELSSGEFIEWKELYPLLVDINTHTENNLLITLAVCQGNYLARIVNPTKKTPVWGLIGIWDKAWDSDMAVSFPVFYDELLTSLDGDKATNKLNDANPDKGYEYIFYSCQRLFRMAYKEHLGKDYTQDALKERTQKLLEREKDTPQYKGMAPRAIKRQLKKKLLKIRKPKFMEYKEKFFMYDLYPENRDRFNVRYEDVVSENEK